MLAITEWLDAALARAHAIMVEHLVKLHRDPAIGMRECADAIRAAAEISAFTKAKICAERGGLPDVVGLAAEEVIALAATPTRSLSVTEDAFERFYLAAWATVLHATRPSAEPDGCSEPDACA